MEAVPLKLHILFFDRPAPLNSVVLQPVAVTNPFGTLPAMPQISINQSGNSPSVQYGISSMPVSLLFLLQHPFFFKISQIKINQSPYSCFDVFSNKILVRHSVLPYASSTLLLFTEIQL